CLVCLCCFCRCLFLLFSIALATSEIYTLSLHDALPIFFQHHADRHAHLLRRIVCLCKAIIALGGAADDLQPISVHLRVLFGCLADRKSTRLNSSHVSISYAVFCLKKKINAY